MELIETLLGEHAPALTAALSAAGLSTGEAESFVPAASEEVVRQLQASGGPDPGSLLKDGADLSGFLGGLDVVKLAGGLGLTEPKTQGALAVFVPLLLELLSSKGGGALASLLQGSDAQGGLAQAGKLARKLFGN